MRAQWNNLQHSCRRLWQKDVIFWQRHKKKIISWTFIIFHVLGALSSIRAIMDTRTPQGAIAWAVSLNTFPYIAVPAYWVFGAAEFDDYIVARQEARKAGKDIGENLKKSLSEKGLLVSPLEGQARVLQDLSQGMAFTTGNNAEYLINGGRTFESILNGINEAKDYILFQFYIIRDDQVGRQFRDALVRKAKEGVRVYAMYDEVGSLGLKSSFKKPLIDAGGKFLPFNTTQGFGNRFRLNFRNHRKVVVIDGKQAWIGGINIGEEYSSSSFGSEGPPAEFFRDTHLRMEGPIVQMVQAIFMEDWYWADRKFPELKWDPEVSTTSSLKMLALPSGPVDEFETCALFYLSAINNAKKRVWISSPYFVPDEQIVSALTLAVLRGVDVRIMIPEKTDSSLIDTSHRGIIGRVERSGIKVYRYEKGFNHQKIMLVDDNHSYVGTANFDNRSFRLNFEITVVVSDQGFAKKTEQMLEKDFQSAVAVPEKYYENSGFWKQFMSRVALLLAPIQ